MRALLTVKDWAERRRDAIELCGGGAMLLLVVLKILL